MITWLPLIVLAITLIIGCPIYICMLCSGASYFFINPNVGTYIVPQLINAGIMKFSFLAVPFFVLSGICMNAGGITKRLMNFCEVIIGHLRGGLAHVNILLSTLMGGLSGSNVADCAMEAKMLVPEMEKHGFSKEYSAVITAVSSLITPIIPPGVGMILYSFISDVSVGKMFMAGFIPGALMCIEQMLINSYISKKRGYMPERDKRASAKEMFNSGKNSLSALFFPVIIIVGIRCGVFTATEAGAIAVVYAIILGLFFYREASLKKIFESFNDAAVTTCNSLMIFGCANVFAWYVTNEKLSTSIATVILQFVHSPAVFMLMFIFVCLILGMFLDGTTIMIILIPLLLPAVKQMGIDLVYFGIIYLLCSAVGNVTPPVGVVMYTVCDITGVKVKDFTKECLPFYGIMVLNVLILAALPQVIMFLPNLFK